MTSFLLVFAYLQIVFMSVGHRHQERGRKMVDLFTAIGICIIIMYGIMATLIIWIDK